MKTYIFFLILISGAFICSCSKDKKQKVSIKVIDKTTKQAIDSAYISISNSYTTDSSKYINMRGYTDSNGVFEGGSILVKCGFRCNDTYLTCSKLNYKSAGLIGDTEGVIELEK